MNDRSLAKVVVVVMMGAREQKVWGKAVFHWTKKEKHARLIIRMLPNKYIRTVLLEMAPDEQQLHLCVR